MSSGEMVSGIKVVTGIQPQSVSGAVNGTEFDTAGWDEACVVLQAGAITSGGTLDCKIQETDVTGSGYADITGAAFTQRTNALQNTILIGRLKLGVPKARKRYMRVVMTQATQAALGACSVILGQNQGVSLAANEGGYQDLDFDKQ